jgi:tRNA threonylcarbamoyladenosine biosynthesis protein TsaB
VSAAVRLVLDTALDRSVVALRRGPSGPVEDGSATERERGAAAVGMRLAALMTAAGARPADLAAVGVGIGPGSFTGLRVGMATAKTLAWSLGIPLVGIPTGDALRRAAARAVGLDATDAAGIAVVQGAGARDHYLALPGEPPRLLPPGADLVAAIGGCPAVALGVDPERLLGAHGPGSGSPLATGSAALAGLGAVLLDLLEERLAMGVTDDPATLVPAYVALPRGVGATVAATAGWSPDLR